jgi:hypothetical protein
METTSTASGSLGLKSQWARIKFAYQKEDWEKLISKLDRDNAILRELLGGSNRLLSGRAQRRDELPPSWKDFRERASSLFDALVSAWQCNCNPQFHCANLLLGDADRRNKEICEGEQVRKSPSFKLWFSCAVAPHDTPQMLRWDWHCTEAFTFPHSPSTQTQDSSQLAPSAVENTPILNIDKKSNPSTSKNLKR